jgi:hypothetical protein
MTCWCGRLARAMAIRRAIAIPFSRSAHIRRDDGAATIVVADECVLLPQSFAGFLSEWCRIIATAGRSADGSLQRQADRAARPKVRGSSFPRGGPDDRDCP